MGVLDHPADALTQNTAYECSSRTPLFSVVVPTYNRVEKLRRALQSIRAQSIDDYEIVIVDDGSSDDTPIFLASCASDARLTWIRNANSGVSAARNSGVATARGEYVVFLDDDDELRPNALANLRALCTASPAPDFLWGGRKIHTTDSAGDSIGSREDDWSKVAQPLSGTEFLPFVLRIATNSALTIRRTIFNEVGGFDNSLMVSEDRDLFLRLARGNYRARVVTQTIIDVDEHFRDSLSRNVGLHRGPGMDLRVIEKHRAYLERPENRGCLEMYLLGVYARFLQLGERRCAREVMSELRRRHATGLPLLSTYLRHAPEFSVLRALKSRLGRSRLRRFLGRAALSIGHLGTRTPVAEEQVPLPKVLDSRESQ